MAHSTSPSPPRRTTRSSLARFAYNDSAPTPESTATELSFGSDIEDAVTTTSRKRRRVTTTRIKAGSPVAYVKTEEIEADVVTSPAATQRKARKPVRVIKGENGASKIEPPSDWEEMYELVKDMRLNGVARNAAVDTMGCERLADPKASPLVQRFHTLIALMLSSQTKDTTNAVAMQRLKTELPAHKPGGPVGLNLDNILAVEPALLNELIWIVGFHNNKTKYIKQAAVILRDKWNGDIPDSIEGLTSLPGVGPKMAYLCLSRAWNRTEGIGVDVHVHRITNMWGWNKTNQPEGTRLALQSWLPKDKWSEINWLLVGFGQTTCLPVGRKCGDCELGLRGLCKAADRKKVGDGRKLREQKLKAEANDTVVKTENIKEELVVEDKVSSEDITAR